MAWLDSLSRHSVFTLPRELRSDDQPASPSSSSPAPHTPAKGAASHAAAPSPFSRAGALSQSASSRSLFGLSSSSPGASASVSSPHKALKRTQRSSTRALLHGAGPHDVEKRIRGARTSRMVVVRGSDLVVAVGSELRIASLADVKSQTGEDDAVPLGDDSAIGDYKTLNTPAINFEIQHLVVNPTNKLLAVVGAHSVVVVVLPRRGWNNSLSPTIECRCLPIGPFYHALPGSFPVASALWHPLGLDASSLLILTADCTLREYTVSESVDEPTQVFSFSRASPADKQGSASARKGFGFSALERDASTATAMCIGEGKGDWGPLTLYALLRNGDVVSMCPFLPKKASVEPSYLHALSAFVSAKVDYLSSSSSALTPFDPFASTSSSLADPALPPQQHAAIEKRYSLQQQYVNALIRQLTSPSRALPTNADDDEAHDPHAPVKLVAPSRPAFAPRLQGPFLLQPAPAELDNGADPAACDLAYLSYARSEREGAALQEASAGEALGVFAIAYRDGKVDLCLEVEKVEARFAGEAEPRGSAASAQGTPRRSEKGAVVLRRKGRGFGAAAVWSDEEDEEAAAPAGVDDDLPTLAVYESIDLGLAAELSSSGDEAVVARGLAHNCPVLVRDPLYADTLYVQHALGAHCLLLGPWLEGLVEALQGAEGEGDEEDKALERDVEKALKEQKGTEVLWVLKTAGAADEERGAPPLEGLAVLNDVYLGYSLLLLTSSLQFLGIELALRVDPSAAALDSPSAPSTPAQPAAAAERAYVSLLDTPFSVPPLLARVGAPPALPRLASTSKKELAITPDTLRTLGKHVSTVQTAVRDLVSAADTVQSRLELQMKELARQVGKLSDLDARRAELGKSVAGGVEGRVRAVEQAQRALLDRTDRVLQRLVESHQPEVSAPERKWFDELRRLEAQIEGAPDGDGAATSLTLRARRLEAQLETLRPALEELRRKGAVNGTPQRGALGKAQLDKVENRLSDEAKLIAETKRKVERLTSTLSASSLF
ncbi:hypothetical protein Rhopal_000781-T1 [Rhodotorula paludigena]|uniref:Nucleoporin Nup82 n=1 Tax=Rhodotorula paludigena TaxID=86838 RepID=A0AAV5G5M7_9BASI|nr:hypothetical protein Rhopal_000781-T1 [Rhodotorula paludigena]